MATNYLSYMGRPYQGTVGGNRTPIAQGARPHSYHARTGNRAVDNMLASMQRQQNAANEANQKRYRQIVRGYDQLASDSQLLNRQQATDALGSYSQNVGDTLAAYNEASRGINRQYQDRLDRNMGYVRSYGDSERAAIDRRQQQASAAANANAMNRGLGNTTISEALQRGVRADAGVEYQNLGDRLARLRYDVDSRLSGDAIGAQQAQANAQFNYMGQSANNQADMRRFYDQMLSNTAQRVPMERLAMMERRTDRGPDTSQMADIAMRAAQADQDRRSSFWGNVVGGLGAVAGPLAYLAGGPIAGIMANRAAKQYAPRDGGGYVPRSIRY